MCLMLLNSDAAAAAACVRRQRRNRKALYVDQISHDDDDLGLSSSMRDQRPLPEINNGSRDKKYFKFRIWSTTTSRVTLTTQFTNHAVTLSVYAICTIPNNPLAIC